MSRRNYVCRFQAIKAPYRNEPLRVLEERFLPASECTLTAAKAMFMMRFEDKSYSRKYGALWPDAVRFLDERGEEVLRYTSWNYLRETTAREGNDHEAAYG
jgi:exonuclease III